MEINVQSTLEKAVHSVAYTLHSNQHLSTLYIMYSLQYTRLHCT